MPSQTDQRFDLVIHNVRLEEGVDPIDIGIRDRRIVCLEAGLSSSSAQRHDGEGAFAFPGFVDSHIHLDKACILDRCTICHGTLQEAVEETARAKSGFQEDDVYARAASVVEEAVTHGTTRMRTFVEIDPRAGFRSFEALKRLRQDYAFAIDIEICAFAQEGLTNETDTLDMLDWALANGADLVGGCPYTDPDPQRHVELIFDLAVRHDVAVDFHLDFDLDPAHTNLPAVVAQTLNRGWQGRVSIGHVTNLSAMADSEIITVARQLSDAGISLTVLPATDLFLNGRQHDRLVPRGVAPAHRLACVGVTTSIATNNILNPFTPYGDGSLIRMANLYANVTQLARDADLALAFDMTSVSAARQLGGDYGLKVGGPATIVLLDTTGPQMAVREIAHVIAGWKDGHKTFDNGRRHILRPAKSSAP